MYLKALEIQGFKSFPDKTVLNFGEDITAIVGPNGSGKSNIVGRDPLGHGRAVEPRSLRGAKMEDVIFGGTAKAQPDGLRAGDARARQHRARLLPMEESEVAVTRRYYRSGESEYYINKQSRAPARTSTSCSWIPAWAARAIPSSVRASIDEILSVKSADRREIFEEAAGISKFRHRKEETERKLERTEENLVRINDKIAELELQVGPLRSQAEKAKKYLDPPRRAAHAGDLRLARKPGQDQDRFHQAQHRLCSCPAGAGARERRAGRAVRRLRAVCGKGTRERHGAGAPAHRVRRAGREARRGGRRRGGAAHGHRAQPREHRARGERPARPVGPRGEPDRADRCEARAHRGACRAGGGARGGASRLPRAGGGACPHGRRGRQRGRGSAREGSAGGHPTRRTAART